MQSAVVKRSIVIAGHKTSVSLEDDFWSALKEIKRSNNVTLSGLVADIDVRRLHANLSSAISDFCPSSLPVSTGSSRGVRIRT